MGGKLGKSEKILLLAAGAFVLLLCVLTLYARLSGMDGGWTVEPARSASASELVPAVKKVNLNTAPAQELETLPGIGPALAQRIVADREAGGPFADTEELMRVDGIGEKKYEGLKEQITVEDEV